MDTFLLFGLVGFACCILGVLGLTATTNKIIKEQEREIAALTTENKRLKNYIKVLNHAARSGHNIAPVDPERVGIKFKAFDELFKEW